ncbi:hypothetical protein GLAREA_02259 [Glarea lozoyensis ATCC 20868]|uniref:Uncharacterized protein n=1 Tax=Glarea lozoyensis (strain ATCC 20868 / MF5171) TaxID=1116229 RepID=S3CIN7_GLAL2|nr:uncharacterized protein GLAREA_02259 [Glarea lozoyensis ATCC 20868]EPE26347.1 hypothetical protein GLAREA_02259 [Glarea lozoyensis ATCC 20868]
MPPSQGKRLTDKQRGMVDAILKAAIDGGTCFNSRLAVNTYLKDVVADDLLLSCGDEIVDRCFVLYAEQNTQLRSPSLTDTSQLSPLDTSQDEDDTSDDDDSGSPSFGPESPTSIKSYLHPHANDYRSISVKTCRGGVSYISRTFVLQQLCAGLKTHIILEWTDVGSGKELSRTRCEVVDPKQLSDCQLALAEHHGKNDSDIVERLLQVEENIEANWLNEASGSLEAAASPKLAAQYSPLVLSYLAQLQVMAAIEMAKSKRKLALLDPIEINSGAPNKRRRQE